MLVDTALFVALLLQPHNSDELRDTIERMLLKSSQDDQVNAERVVQLLEEKLKY